MHEVTIQEIQASIISLPNRPPAMPASALADLYQVKTERINEAVKRNQKRFPEDFSFQCTEEEFAILTSQNAMSSGGHGGQRHLPKMFTRNGANMLSAVLKSDVAVERSIQIMRAFSAMEENTSPFPINNMEQFAQVLTQVLPALQVTLPQPPFVNTAAIKDFLHWLPYELNAEQYTVKTLLFDTYTAYCSEKGIHQEAMPHFFTKLYRCEPTLKGTRLAVDGVRTAVVRGITLQLQEGLA